MRNWEHTLDGWEAELLGNLGVLHFARLIEAHATNKLSEIAAGSDGRSAAEGLELDVRDLVGLRVNTDLQLHHITTCRCTDKTCADIHVLLVHRADIARLRVVIEDLLVVRPPGVDGGDRCELAGGREGGWPGERCADGAAGSDADGSGEHCDGLCEGD